MKPNIVFLDAFSLGGADLSRITKLGNYTEYQTSTSADVIERCKDADIVIWDGNPLEIGASVKAAFINGQQVWPKEDSAAK